MRTHPGINALGTLNLERLCWLQQWICDFGASLKAVQKAVHCHPPESHLSTMNWQCCRQSWRRANPESATLARPPAMKLWLCDSNKIWLEGRNLSSSQVSASNHEWAIMPTVMKVVGTRCLPTLVLITAFKIGRPDTDEMCLQGLNLSSTKVSKFDHAFWLHNAEMSGRTSSNCHRRVHSVKRFVSVEDGWYKFNAIGGGRQRLRKPNFRFNFKFAVECRNFVLICA